jgi:hypothetical protein
MGRFETRWLTAERNLAALADLVSFAVTRSLVDCRYETIAVGAAMSSRNISVGCRITWYARPIA